MKPFSVIGFTGCITIDAILKASHLTISLVDTQGLIFTTDSNTESVPRDVALGEGATQSGEEEGGRGEDEDEQAGAPACPRDPPQVRVAEGVQERVAERGADGCGGGEKGVERAGPAPCPGGEEGGGRGECGGEDVHSVALSGRGCCDVDPVVVGGLARQDLAGVAGEEDDGHTGLQPCRAQRPA